MAAIGLAGAVVAAAWIGLRSKPVVVQPVRAAVDAPPLLDWKPRVAALAGDGHVGWRDGAAAQAQFADPYGVALDPHGTLYVSDGGDNDRIRALRPDGTVATLAGGVEGFQDGQGAAARFDTPSGLALDATGNLYVADTGNHAIRKVTPDGVVTTLAGTGAPGYRDGPGAQAQFDGPMGLAVDGAGRVIVADAYNDRIRAIAPDGQVTTLAGGASPGDADGPGAQARFDTPCAVLVDAQGRIVVADTRNDALRAIDAAGNVTTLVHVAPGDVEKMLHRPVSLARTNEGNLVVGTLAGAVVEVAADATVHAVFGVQEHGFVRPTGLAIGPSSGLIVADSASSRLHAVWPRGASAADPLVEGALGPAPDRPLPDAGGRWPVRPQLAWHEVVGTIGEDRGDGKGESRDHFHDGLDVRGDIGQEVVAIAAGKVSNPLSTYGFGQINEGLSIGSLAYVHMHVGRGAHGAALDPTRFVPVRDEAGKLARMRVRRGARFAVGDVLGSINQMAHVHLWMGVPGYGLNPLALGLRDFRDTVAPSIGASRSATPTTSAWSSARPVGCCCPAASCRWWSTRGTRSTATCRAAVSACTAWRCSGCARTACRWPASSSRARPSSSRACRATSSSRTSMPTRAASPCRATARRTSATRSATRRTRERSTLSRRRRCPPATTRCASSRRTSRATRRCAGAT